MTLLERLELWFKGERNPEEAQVEVFPVWVPDAKKLSQSSVKAVTSSMNLVWKRCGPTLFVKLLLTNKPRHIKIYGAPQGTLEKFFLPRSRKSSSLSFFFSNVPCGAP